MLRSLFLPGFMRPVLTVAGLTVLCLSPFLGKAFHIDDVLFLWAADHIRNTPLDFYGFSANWYGTVAPMASINQNPPLVAYYLALAQAASGSGEFATHVHFLLPATAVTVGTFYLATVCCKRPELAALAALATPAFLVSATTVMSDVLMVAFYVWALAFWVHGTRQDRLSLQLMAIVCVCGSCLTKYFGITALPLMALFSLAHHTRLRPVLLLLVLPLLVLFGFEVYSRMLYGHGLVSSAAAYAPFDSPDLIGNLHRAITGLSFVGGCLPIAALAACVLSPRKSLPVFAGTALMTCGALYLMGNIGSFVLRDTDRVNWPVLAHASLFVSAGLAVVWQTTVVLRQRCDPVTAMLFCWVIGTVAFATFVNWTTNARTILPIAPALGIIVALWVENRVGNRRLASYAPLIPALAIALGVGWSDLSWADTQREAARRIAAIPRDPDQKLWYQGHWGFQYYMDQHGGQAVDFRRSSLRPGDLVVMPANNTNLVYHDSFAPFSTINITPGGIASTMSSAAGAGFYAALWGPLPYSFGRPPVEQYHVFVIRGS